MKDVPNFGDEQAFTGNTAAVMGPENYPRSGERPFFSINPPIFICVIRDIRGSKTTDITERTDGDSDSPYRFLM